MQDGKILIRISSPLKETDCPWKVLRYSEAILVEDTQMVYGSRSAGVRGFLKVTQGTDIVRLERLAVELATPNQGASKHALCNDGPRSSLLFPITNAHSRSLSGPQRPRRRPRPAEPIQCRKRPTAALRTLCRRALTAAVAAQLTSWYTGKMPSDRSARRVITTRVFRAGQTPPDDDWSGVPVAERIDAVWELTRQCLEWTRTGTDEPRLQRSVSRVQRARR